MIEIVLILFAVYCIIFAKVLHKKSKRMQEKVDNLIEEIETKKQYLDVLMSFEKKEKKND